MAQYLSSVERSLYRKFSQAVKRFVLVEKNDKILVAMSGGKDSYALFHFLSIMKERIPFHFDLMAVHLDQGQPNYDGKPLEAYLSNQKHPYKILKHDTYSIVVDKTEQGKAYCFMCSRLRRGLLYKFAYENGFNKIALGHHRDDALETLFLNMVFSGQLKSMPPKLISDDSKNIVIRPLILCSEDDLHQLSIEKQFPILPCNLCGSQDNLQRKAMRSILDQIEKANKGAKNRMLASLTHVRPTHLLDQGLWRKLGIFELLGKTDEDNDREIPALSDGSFDFKTVDYSITDALGEVE